MRNLYHIPVTQDHLDAGQSATWQNPTGNMAVIPHEGRALSRAALDALRSDGEPVAAVYAGCAVTSVVPGDGQELAYYWRDDGITLMAACDRGARRRCGASDSHAYGPAHLRCLLRQPSVFLTGDTAAPCPAGKGASTKGSTTR